jgi:ribosomal protein L37E
MDRFRPVYCYRCRPAEFARQVDRESFAAREFTARLTFRLPATIECNACGQVKARASDGFCSACGAGDGKSPERYVSWQIADAARLSWPVKPRKTKDDSDPSPKAAPKQTSMW